MPPKGVPVGELADLPGLRHGLPHWPQAAVVGVCPAPSLPSPIEKLGDFLGLSAGWTIPPLKLSL
jgi:hypothetical protein